MHSYFCDQCNLEFDVDEEIDETEDSVFCPECKIHLARPLPETPERIIARERRLRRARAAQYKQLMRLILFTLIVLVIVNAAVLYNSRSAWLMLSAGIILGIPAGCWTRRITYERSWRSAVLAAVMMLIVETAILGTLYLCHKLQMNAAVMNLIAGIIPAGCIASYEKESQ